MQPTPPPPPDLVTVAISAASWIFGANASTAIGTYGIVIVFAVAGAAWSASGRPESERWAWAAFRHSVLMVMLALALAVPLAEALHNYVGLESRWTLAPIAALVAARPDWVIGQLADLWRWWRGNRTPQPGGPNQ